MKRKLLSVLLSVLMLLVTIPMGAISVSAATSGTTGDCTWVLDGTNLTISGNGKMEDYSTDRPNVSWGRPWGYTITAVIIEDGVTAIGDYAFASCKSLVSVTIPDSVTTIGCNAFLSCKSLASVTMGKGVVSIGEEAFNWCDALTSAVIPDSVTIIEREAFANCNALAQVSIGNSVTTIGEGAFCSCDSLTSITIPDSVTTIGDDAFCDCYSLTSVVFGSGVTFIGERAFGWCDSLTSVMIPDNVTNIEVSAFIYCGGLIAIDVGGNNLDYCSVDGVLFNKEKTKLIQYPAGCTSTNYCIPDSVTAIGSYAFSVCRNLTSVTIPNSVTAIDTYAFEVCFSLTDVYYIGTKANRDSMSIKDYSDALSNATWHCTDDPIGDEVQHSVMDTENGNGLAFKFELAASVGIKGQNKVDFTNATINYLGEECKLVGMGAVISNQDGVILELDNVNSKTVIDIPAVYLTDWEPDSCAFAARVINIPNSALERVVYARPYYIVEVDGEQIVVYGDIDTATCAQYMK